MRKTGHPLFTTADGATIADVSLTVTGEVAGPEPVVVRDGNRVTAIEAHGHSWGSAFAMPAGKYGFVQRLAELYGVTLTNGSVAGALIAGANADGSLAKLLQDANFQPDLVAGPYQSWGGLKLFCGGSNDLATYGDTAASRALVERALELTFSWMRAARVIGAGAASITYSPERAAAADTTLSFGAGYDYVASTGDYIQHALDANYNGEAISVLVPHVGASAITGTWTLTDDPAGAATVVATYDAQPYDATLKATPSAATLGFRVPAGTLAAGAHTLRLTASELPGDGTAYLTHTALVVEGDAPLVVPLFPTHPSDDTYDAAFAWANARIRAVAENFSNVLLVDLATVVPDALDWADNAHPSTQGHAKIASAVFEALSALLTVDVMGRMT